jgi:hypothetical protein
LRRIAELEFQLANARTENKKLVEAFMSFSLYMAQKLSTHEKSGEKDV